MKNERYWFNRRKNNEAARISRDAKRRKENQIIMRAAFLEEKNSSLRMDEENIRKDNENLRENIAMLSKRLATYQSIKKVTKDEESQVQTDPT